MTCLKCLIVPGIAMCMTIKIKSHAGAALAFICASSLHEAEAVTGSRSYQPKHFRIVCCLQGGNTVPPGDNIALRVLGHAI